MVTDWNQRNMKNTSCITCSFRTTFPKKSSVPFSFVASLITLKTHTFSAFAWLPGYVSLLTNGVIPSYTGKVAFHLLQYMSEGNTFIFIP